MRSSDSPPPSWYIHCFSSTLLIAISQHLDGHEVEIKRTRITQPGQVLRIKGEGMPQHNFPSDTGDLYVTVQVVIPVGLTAEQRGALAKILPDEH